MSWLTKLLQPNLTFIHGPVHEVASRTVVAGDEFVEELPLLPLGIAATYLVGAGPHQLGVVARPGGKPGGILVWNTGRN